MGGFRQGSNKSCRLAAGLLKHSEFRSSEQQHEFLTSTESPSQITPGAEAATGAVVLYSVCLLLYLFPVKSKKCSDPEHLLYVLNVCMHAFLRN